MVTPSRVIICVSMYCQNVADRLELAGVQGAQGGVGGVAHPLGTYSSRPASMVPSGAIMPRRPKRALSNSSCTVRSDVETDEIAAQERAVCRGGGGDPGR